MNAGIHPDCKSNAVKAFGDKYGWRVAQLLQEYVTWKLDPHLSLCGQNAL
jgi:hypothetical protein